MGTCCKENQPRQILNKMSNIYIPTGNKNYQPTHTYRSNYSSASNKLSNLKTGDTGSTSDGLSNAKTRERTVYDKNTITENDFKKIEKYYYNLLTTSMRYSPKTIGEGGQAKIVKYYDPKFKKVVVKKVIKINVSTSNSLKKTELLDKINLCKEAILLFKCDYPNVIRIYDFRENPVSIVMEYCAKGSLRKILDKNIYLPNIYKIFLIYSICDGLGYIHTKGIIHGDLKCDNILLSDEKKYYIGNKYYPIPKLADFGLSQICPNHVFGGTPGYIAPEVYQGSGLNKKTDIFTLGMVMFEILSGLRPLLSDLEMAMQCFEAKIPPCTKEVMRIAWEKRCEELLPGIKNAYCDLFYTIMIQCIDNDPEKRPDILTLFLTIRKLYKVLLNVSKEKIYDETEALKR